MAIVGAASSSAAVARRLHHDVRAGCPAAGTRALLLPVAPEGIAGKSALRSWEGRSSPHYKSSSSSAGGLPRRWSISSLEKGRKNDGWRSFADLKDSAADAEITENSGSRPDCCDNESTPADSPSEASTTGTSEPQFETFGPTKRGNQLVAVASSSIAVGLFLLGRFGGGGPALPELAASAVSYEEALKNGRPTVLEFYADWCEVCKETARDVYQVEQEYRDRINFVMLNVDNSKWEQELDEFGVEGIPHFAFLDNQGNEEGNIVGRLPRTILKENLAALARGDAKVPHSRVVGQFSSAEPRAAPPVVGPRSHSPTP